MGKKRRTAKTASWALILSLLLSAALCTVPVRAETTVYVTATGTHYHLTRSCTGLNTARKIYETTLSSAKAQNLEPCSICAGPSGASQSGSSSQAAGSTKQSGDSAAAGTAAAASADTAAGTAQTATADRTAKLGDFLKIQGIEKADDGTWITLRLKNVSGKPIRVSQMIVVQDRDSMGYAWKNPPKKKNTVLGKGKERDFKFICYSHDANSSKPKVNKPLVPHSKKEMSYILAFGCGGTGYTYYCNPLKNMKKCTFLDENTDLKDFNRWLNKNNR